MSEQCLPMAKSDFFCGQSQTESRGVFFFSSLGGFRGRSVDSFPAFAFFVLFLSGGQLMYTDCTFLGYGQSTVTQQAGMTVVKCSQMSCL